MCHPSATTGKPRHAVEVARNPQIAAVEESRMLVEHSPQQRQRHVGVVLGAQPGERRLGGVGGLAGLHCGDYLLLGRPDPEPHVEGHHRAKHRSGVDQDRPRLEPADLHEHPDDDQKQHE